MCTALTEMGGDDEIQTSKFKIDANLLMDNKSVADALLKDLLEAIDEEQENFIK